MNNTSEGPEKMNIPTLITWYNNIFKLDKLYLDMENMSEDSKWHRERSIGCHTDMAFANWIHLVSQTETNDIIDVMCAGIAIIFHDVGKPISRTPKYKEERGHYFAYSGHELASARLWEDYAVRNWIMLRDTFELTPNDIYRIGWLIENHRPWGLRKEDKLNELAITVNSISTRHRFSDILWADNKGRVGDNQAENQIKTAEWINQFNARCIDIPDMKMPPPDSPMLMIIIGASGSGKSTFIHDDPNGNADIVHYSLDALRTEWYGDDYAQAFKKSCEDKRFNGNAQREYINLLKDEKSVCVDNTNLSKKRRRGYLTEAKRRGYQTVAILLPVDLQTIIDRQSTRTDKHVPEEAVRRQYAGLSYPSMGEFDYIAVQDGNLPD